MIVEQPSPLQGQITMVVSEEMRLKEAKSNHIC